MCVSSFCAAPGVRAGVLRAVGSVLGPICARRVRDGLPCCVGARSRLCSLPFDDTDLGDRSCSSVGRKLGRSSLFPGVFWLHGWSRWVRLDAVVARAMLWIGIDSGGIAVVAPSAVGMDGSRVRAPHYALCVPPDPLSSRPATERVLVTGRCWDARVLCLTEPVQPLLWFCGGLVTDWYLRVEGEEPLEGDGWRGPPPPVVGPVFVLREVVSENPLVLGACCGALMLTPDAGGAGVGDARRA